MITETFKPISNTKIIPVNGNILLRAEINGFSTLKLLAKENFEFDSKKYYVEGTSVETIPLGVEVILHENRGNTINDPDNERSFKKVSKMYLELKSNEKDDFRKVNPKVDLVEYIMVNVHDIMAIIQQ